MVIPSLDLANGSIRQQRSERREACVILLKALLKHTDVASLRVGIPTEDGFLNLTVNYIANQTGMTLKRVERALKDLKAAGLITVSQPRELKPDGTWRGLAAVKAVSKNLFGAFGLQVMLEKERKKASKRLKEKTPKSPEKIITITSQARSNLFLQATKSSLHSKRDFNTNFAKPPDNEHDQRRLARILIKIKLENPGWNADKIKQEARKYL